MIAREMERVRESEREREQTGASESLLVIRLATSSGYTLDK